MHRRATHCRIVYRSHCIPGFRTMKGDLLVLSAVCFGRMWPNVWSGASMLHGCGLSYRGMCVLLGASNCKWCLALFAHARCRLSFQLGQWCYLVCLQIASAAIVSTLVVCIWLTLLVDMPPCCCLLQQLSTVFIMIGILCQNACSCVHLGGCTAQ